MSVNEVLLSTRYEVWPDLITDTVFTKTPTLARLREYLQLWSGGAYMSNIFRHSGLIPSFYKIGATHTITKKQTTDEMTFEPKYSQVSVPEFLEELEVLNTQGALQIYSLLDEDLSNGLDSLETMWAISTWGGGTTNIEAINGFDEAIGHATLPSWNGVVAATYGGASRAVYGNKLNGQVYWGGKADGTTAPISYNSVNSLITACTFGDQTPDTVVMNKALMASIEDKMQSQQVMMDFQDDPYWGGMGFKIKKALCIVDEYCPSLVNGQTDAQTGGFGNYLTAAFTNPVTVALNGFPIVGNAATLTPGEVIFALNMNYWGFRLSDAERYQFGLSDFMQTPDSEKIVARIYAAGNLQCFSGSKYQGQKYGYSA